MRLIDFLGRCEKDTVVCVYWDEYDIIFDAKTCEEVWNKMDYNDLCNYRVYLFRVEDNVLFIEVC